jgi:non-heme chloroperoxidase
MKPEIQTAELPNQVNLQYVEQGDPVGIPVVLLHGLSDSWHSFELVLPHLPPSIRAVALSQRGHGDSSKPDSGYRADDFAADAAGFLDALELEAAVVVGHSMGSASARRFAAAHPERTLALALLASFATPRENPNVRELWREVSRMDNPVDPDFVHEFQQSTLTGPVPESFFETVVQESLKVPAHVWKGVVGSDVQEDYLTGLDEIEASTLIVSGDQDRYCPPADQEAIAAAIPDARREEYADVGHAVHWQAPERFAADLVTFIDHAMK